MKKLILILILGLISIQNGFSQMGMGGTGRGMGNSGMGNQGMQPPMQQRKPEKVDFVKEMLDKMETDLKIDAFQRAVIKEALDQGQASMESIFNSKEDSDQIKEDKMAAVRERTENRILKVLDKRQTELYKQLKESKGKKKGKKEKPIKEDELEQKIEKTEP